MSRKFIVAGAQLGPIAKDESRASAVARMCGLMRAAYARGAALVVFPELALTTFFPRWFMTNEAEIDKWFEFEMPNATVAPLFELTRELGVGFHLGYAELTPEGRHFNTAIIVSPAGEILARAATTGDEVITAEVDLDRCAEIRANVFNFAQHREPQDYAPITAPKGS